MKRLLCAVLVGCALVFGASQAVSGGEITGSQQLQRKAYREGQAIVVYSGTTSEVQSKARKGGIAFQVKKTYTFSQNTAVRSTDAGQLRMSLVSSSSLSTQELVKKLSGDSSFSTVSPNYLYYADSLTNDTFSSSQWFLQNTGQNGGTAGLDLNIASSWNAGLSGNQKVVAVLDTGIDYTQEDLKNRMWVNPYQDLKGTYGYDFANGDDDPMDDSGHGSHCAGIIGAQKNNGLGISGISPNVKLMALKFMDSQGVGDLSGIIGAYNYIYRAQSLGTQVVAINNSWGGIAGDVLEKLIDLTGQKGALSICAAGNEGENIDKVDMPPATLDSEYIISVGAVNEKGVVASFSNYGKKNVDLFAPGTNIVSTVSSYCFASGLYGGSKKSQLCQYVNNFNRGNSSTYGVKSSSGALGTVKTSFTSKIYFGTDTSKERSLSWKITGAKKGERYCIYFPYTASGTGKIYDDAMFTYQAPKTAVDTNDLFADMSGVSVLYGVDLESSKIEEELSKTMDDTNNIIGGVYLTGNYKDTWNHLTGEAATAANGNQRVMMLVLDVETDGDYQLGIDNVGVSRPARKGTDTDPAQFGKYDISSGTSMAVPVVTGCAVLASQKLGGSSILNVKNYLLASAKRMKALSNKCETGGMVELTQLTTSNPVLYPVISSVKLSGTNVVVSGKYFGTSKGTISINGKTVAASAWKSGSITIANKNYKNHSLTVTVKTKKGLKTSAQMYLKAGKANYKTSTIPYPGTSTLYDNSTEAYFSDGQNPWYAYISTGDNDMMDFMSTTTGGTSSNLYLYQYTNDILGEDEEEEGPMWRQVSAISMDELQKGLESSALGIGQSVTAKLMGTPVYQSGSIYVLLNLSVSYSDLNVMLRINLESEEYSIIDLPAVKGFDQYDDYTLGYYNQDVVLIGGINLKTGALSKHVYSYSSSNDSWSTLRNLPEGRADASIYQVGKKLVVTLGTDGTSQVPYTYVYDGKSWKKCGKRLSPVEDATDGIELEDGTYLPEYGFVSGICKGGILFAGVTCEGLGDTFVYNVSKNSYSASSGIFTNASTSAGVAGFVCNNQVCLISNSQVNSSMSTDMSQTIYFRYRKIQTGGYGVILDGKNSKYVTGLGYYLPGQAATVQIGIKKKGEYISAVYLNGSKKKVNDKTLSTYSFLMTKDVKVKAVIRQYITKLKLSSTSLTLYYNQKNKKQLKVTFTPGTGVNQGVTWKSSNKKYATVSAKGVVTVKKAGKGKTVNITCTAKDGSKIKAVCKVKIRTYVKLKKIKLNKSYLSAKAGKKVTLKTSFSPSNASVKKVSWSSSNKNYATVTSKGVVSLLKAGKGKTVTITCIPKESGVKKWTCKIKIL